MTEQRRKPKPAGPRTEVFAMRLDPKLKYLAEIAARKQRRSLANFIEWALEQALAKVKLVGSDDFLAQNDRSVFEEANKLWDLEPSDRLIKLAENYPNLLTYDEQIIWKAIFEITARESFEDAAGKTTFFTYNFVLGEGNNRTADPVLVRKCWPALVTYAAGNATVEDVEASLKKAIF